VILRQASLLVSYVAWWALVPRLQERLLAILGEDAVCTVETVAHAIRVPRGVARSVAVSLEDEGVFSEVSPGVWRKVGVLG